jgi:hypothetical protein
MNNKERYKDEITKSAYILIKKNGNCTNVNCTTCPAFYTEESYDQCAGGDVVTHAKEWLLKYDKPTSNIYSEDEDA